MSRSFTKIGLLLAAAVMVMVAMQTATAQARSVAACDRVGVKLSSQVLVPGQAMRVGGRACGFRAERRPRVLRVEMRARNRSWRPVVLARTNRAGRYVRTLRVPRTNRRHTHVRVVGHGVRSRPLPVRFAHRAS